MAAIRIPSGDGAPFDNLFRMRATGRSVQIVKTTTEDPELANRFNLTLADTIEALEEAGIKYAFIGGIASSGLGRPRSTHDIDIFIMPEDAELTLRALARKGFRIEKTDPSWLYKGFKHGILVDVIFKSKGEIYFDTEMNQRTITAEFHGKRIRLVAPEDLLIIKAAAHSELTPGHWHDATALLSHATIDWDYLIRRAKRAPRRILSLLLYAQSNDIWVPNYVIDELYRGIFGGERHSVPSSHLHGNAPINFGSQNPATQTVQPPTPSHAQAHQIYGIAHLREILAEDSRTNELDIQIEGAGNKILLRGEVTVLERKAAVEQIARECFPKHIIDNQITVSEYTEPEKAEEIK